MLSHNDLTVRLNNKKQATSSGLLLLFLALLPSLALLRAAVSSAALLGPSLKFRDHLCHVKHHVFTCRKEHADVWICTSTKLAA